MENIKLDNYNKENIIRMYDQFYDKKDFTKFPKAEKAFIYSLIKKVNITSNLQLLDIGCGTGKYTYLFSFWDIPSIGVDISERGIEIAKMKYPHCKFKVGDATNLEFNKNSFDVIFCSGLSIFNEENLDNTIPFVQYLIEFLKPGGLFVFLKTSLLTNKYSKNNSRFDHSLNSFKLLFDKINNLHSVLHSSTLPHTFLIFGKFGFNRYISSLSQILPKIFNIPVRVCLVYKKQDNS